MRPASYDKKELIDFTKPLRWMNGVEQYKNPISRYRTFVVFCIIIGVYFLTRGMWG